MYEMKIAAGARSERAAATLGVHTDKGTQKTLAFHQQRVYDLLQSCKNILPQTFPSPCDCLTLGAAYAI